MAGSEDQIRWDVNNWRDIRVDALVSEAHEIAASVERGDCDCDVAVCNIGKIENSLKNSKFLSRAAIRRLHAAIAMAYSVIERKRGYRV